MVAAAKEKVVVSDDLFAFRRGETSFARGEPWPPYAGNPGARVQRAFWTGYHSARMRAFFEQRRVKQLLGVDD